VDVRTVSQADPVTLVRHEKVIVTQGAVKKLEEMLA
jgi:large subunit ribosomal protein L4